MIPFPIFVEGDSFAPSHHRPPMHFREEEVYPSCFWRCPGDHSSRSSRPCLTSPVTPNRPTRACHAQRGSRSAGNLDSRSSQLLGLLHPWLASIGRQTGQRISFPQQEPCCSHVSCCPEAMREEPKSHQFSERDVVDHLFGLDTREDNMMGEENVVSNILKNLFQVNGNNKTSRAGIEKTSKWHHEVDCSGFLPDNVFVKMAGGNVFVKAAREDRSRDGSVSMKRMEKRIPIPGDVIPEKIKCKMQVDSVLKIEGPRKVVQRKTSHGKTNATTPKKGQAKADVENGCQVKVLPNGAMIFTSLFPNLEAMCEGIYQQEDRDSSRNSDMKEADNKKAEGVVNEIPVQFVKDTQARSPSTTESIDKEEIFPNDCSEPTTTSQMPEDGPMNKERGDLPDTEHNDATCLMTSDDILTEHSNTINTSEKSETEVGEAYTIELAESECEDDSASTDSKDSDSSFVLLTEQDNPVVIKDADVSGIEEAIQEADSEAEEKIEVQNEQPEKENPSMDTDDSKAVNDITKLITDAVPNLQKFILNMNDPSKVPQGAFDPQNFAKIMTDAMPGIQNLVMPKVSMESSPTNITAQVEEKDKGHFTVRLELPVCIPESIRVTMDDEQRLLHITARKKNAGLGENISKSIEVPHSANVTKLRCQYSDGLLTITAPYKTDGKTTRTIPVDV